MDLLPVELIYQIQLYALSAYLPHVSTHLYHLFKSAPPSFHADYIIARVLAAPRSTSAPLTRALRYPICTTAVLDALCRHPASHTLRTDVPELPRRLFKHLAPCVTPRDPLPFLARLYALPALQPPDVNAHGGFALAQAVRAGCVPLVRFLLERGADPGRRNAQAVMAAIRRGDLALLRLLVEREAPGRSERRRLEDRVRLGPAMVRAAVECDARAIVEYLTKEKGCVPDMRTLTMAAEMAAKVRAFG